MFHFKDFVPDKLSSGGLFSPATYETLGVALKEAKEWSAKKDLDIINIETVVLPNMHDRNEKGSSDTNLWQGGETSASWHQFIRVWYRE